MIDIKRFFSRFSEPHTATKLGSRYRLGCERLDDRATPALVTFYGGSGSFIYDEGLIDAALSSQTIEAENFTFNGSAGPYASSNAVMTYAYGQFVSLHADATGTDPVNYPTQPPLGIDVDSVPTLTVVNQANNTVVIDHQPITVNTANATVSISTQPYQGPNVVDVKWGTTFANAPSGAYMKFEIINVATGLPLANNPNQPCNAASATLTNGLSVSQTDRGKTVKVVVTLYNSQGVQLDQATSNNYTIP